MVYGAQLIAQSLKDLGVQVIFGLPGLPVIDIAQEGINLGIRFISFRNEQAAVYAACAYGYLTGRPGVCISVGGPGMLHIMAGIPHAAANAWPLLVLSGSSETHNANKGAFQELDALPMITPMAKLALRPPYAHMVPDFIRDAYRIAMFGRPGPCYIDLPADIILGRFDVPRKKLAPITEAPLPTAPAHKIKAIADAFKSAKAPLVVLGKGAAYARAEKQIRALIDNTGLNFVPSPMAKGIVPDSSPNNLSAARSAAFREADVVLVLGGRLNWVLNFGLPPKWNPDAKVIQVDLSAEEIGKNGGHPTLSVVGDIGLVVEELTRQLEGWKWAIKESVFHKNVMASKEKNEGRAAKSHEKRTSPMSYQATFNIIKETLDSLSNPEDGNIVYCSEGANAMDISRAIFTMEHPRIRLDAGTYATMGVGLAYAIAAFAAYNFKNPEGVAGAKARKKIIAIEGDSAFGLSAMEVETMARYNMDIITYVINNGGLYRGDSPDKEDWKMRQKASVEGDTAVEDGLSAISLGFETDYQKMAELAGGIGYVVRTSEELIKATKEAYAAKVPVVINVLVDPNTDLVMDFSWLDMAPPGQKMTMTDSKRNKVTPKL